jgi:hypothetical protein
MRRRTAATCLVMAILVVAGCSKPPPPVTVEVTFQVSFGNGQPVTDMILSLHPEDGNVERPQPTALDKSGKCTVRCSPGVYKATLLAPPTHGGASPAGGLVTPSTAPGKSTVPKTYLTLADSPWTVTISEASHEEKLVVQTTTAR